MIFIPLMGFALGSVLASHHFETEVAETKVYIIQLRNQSHFNMSNVETEQGKSH